MATETEPAPPVSESRLNSRRCPGKRRPRRRRVGSHVLDKYVDTKIYSGPVAFSPEDELINEEDFIPNLRRRICLNRPKIKLFRFGSWWRKEQEIMKIEQVLRGSNCKQFVCRVWNMVPQDMLQRLVSLEEERLRTLEEIRTVGGSMEKTVQETSEVLKKLEDLMEDITQKHDKVILYQTHF